MSSNPTIVHAYRQLLRAGLRAVQFSKPARYGIRDQLRAGFRNKKAQFDAEGARRTVWFLNAAASERGLEHKIVKNLLHVYRMRTKYTPTYKMLLNIKQKTPDPIKGTAFLHYERTIILLNDTMGLRLRG